MDPKTKQSLVRQAMERQAINFKTDKQVEEWVAKTDARVRTLLNGLLSKMKTAIATTARTAKVSPADVQKLVKKMVSTSFHGNKVAFDFLFPRAKGFDFTDLDFRGGNPAVEALDPAQIKRYVRLANGLGTISDLQYKAISWYHHKGSGYRNLPLWDEKPYSEFAKYGSTKTASYDVFFEIVDKRKWSAIRQALNKAGDKQSVGLWSEASLKLSKALELSTNEEYALNRMKNLMDRPTTDPAGMRNQVFKIANELGIKLPSGMFASTKTAKAHRTGLPPYESWRKFVETVQLREMMSSTTPQTAVDLEHALRELRNYAAHSPEHARDLKVAIASIQEALEIHNKQAQLSRDFDKRMTVIRGALKKLNQL